MFYLCFLQYNLWNPNNLLPRTQKLYGERHFWFYIHWTLSTKDKYMEIIHVPQITGQINYDKLPNGILLGYKKLISYRLLPYWVDLKSSKPEEGQRQNNLSHMWNIEKCIKWVIYNQRQQSLRTNLQNWAYYGG